MGLVAERIRHGLYFERDCRRCGGLFEVYDSRRRYCDNCKTVTEPVPEGTNPVTESRWPPPRFPWSVCEECGCGFRPVPIDKATGEPVLLGVWGRTRWLRGRRDARYCSNACRQKAYRQRQVAT